MAVRVVELGDIVAHHEAAGLLCRVWRAADPAELVNPSLLRALAHSGNYVAGAYAGGTLVGASVAFLGDGHLHSHITGVVPGAAGRGIGQSLKQHQRSWALARGIDAVHWTFDPLVRRNAFFNVVKLGGLPTEYLTDFYGSMVDGINTGDPTDRLYLVWELASSRAESAVRGELTAVDPVAARATGAILVGTPPDIEALRSTDPAGATRWRYQVRDAMTAALAQGYRFTGMAGDGSYVLEVDR